MSASRTKPAVCRPGKAVAYQYDPATFTVTDEMKAVFDWDGAFIVRGLFNQEEIDKINHQLNINPEFTDRSYELSDGIGRKSRLALWSHCGSDVTGMVGRTWKMAGTCQELLGGEVYHYHTKLMMKQARTGGRHLWHQDYGYWYKNGLLTPNVMTAYVALDKCVKENGCLQAVLGTQRCGRIDHVPTAGQTAADPRRVEELLKQFHSVYVELDPGDTLFFHSNLLHMAGKNDSDMRRWTFLCSYNRKDNNPVYEHHHPQYTPLHIEPNDAVLKCDNFMDLSGKDFLDANTDKTVNANFTQTGLH